MQQKNNKQTKKRVDLLITTGWEDGTQQNVSIFMKHQQVGLKELLETGCILEIQVVHLRNRNTLQSIFYYRSGDKKYNNTNKINK